MPMLIAHQLSFQLDTGEWLFQDINFSLDKGITGLVGRNGVGKSVLVSLLFGKLAATKGNVTCQGKVYSYSQLPSDLLEGNLRISDFLGITDKLLALAAIEEGSFDQLHFNVVAEDWDIEIRTQQILISLRITPDLNAYCHALSGGQLVLLQLHKLFSSDAEILLLDEPSNHLDLEGKEWLINQCKQFNGQILLVSHDRDLLRHVQGIYQLTSLGLSFFNGNYDSYLEQSSGETEALERQQAHLKSQQKKILRQAQINKEKAQQREAQGNRIRKSGSQPKVLMDAKKDKAGRSRSASVINQQNQLARNEHKLHALKKQITLLKPQALYLQQSEQIQKRSLLHIEECRLNYGSRKSLSFTISQTDRCHLEGANGCGKSTLLKAIQGEHSNYSGVIKRNVETIYLDEHFGMLKFKGSMLDSLMKCNEELTETVARTLLAGIGFRRDSVYRKVVNLSGGEKMKLSMLTVSHSRNSPLLLLDEPDNHLDIQSKQILAAVLSAYKGAFIIVSHDKYFIKEVGINERILME